VLTIKCARCGKKLFKYEKIGPGEVLRCHKDRITKVYDVRREGDKIQCVCGRTIGIDRGGHIKMIQNAFTYRGTKINK